ncbi:MAG TPA: AAA family ATPase [Oleiagrimonas sp.]|nr:AAA family ATPase [Oleiagrimonas sp.]
MSIVERAMEKLKTRQPEAQAPLDRHENPTPPTASAPTIERAHERMQVVEPSESPAAEPPWPVDMDRLRRDGLVPLEQGAERRLIDELRRIKRPLLNNTGGERARTLTHPERIMVTSAIPAEGKTFTTLNLALSLAREPDFEVLLIDGDIPKSNITRSLGLEEKPGLMDVLVHADCRPQDVIVRTDVPNLLVVPTGERHPLTAELFGGKRMQRVLEAWSNPDRQRLLLFDSSPLLATSEAQVLASHVGQIVMIVAAGRTRQQEVRTAMQGLGESQYVGFVLNMSRLPAMENHYYDDYYSNYYSHSTSRSEVT